MVSYVQIVLLAATTAIVYANYMDDVVERGRTIANATTGSYHLLSPHVLLPKTAVSPRCPHALKLIVQHEINQEFLLPLPIGLTDPSSLCTNVTNFAPVNVKLLNYGQTIGAVSVFLTKKALLAHQTYLTGKLPTGALRCGNDKEFVRVTILSLKGPVASLLRVLFEHAGVPQAKLDKALSGKQEMPEWVSDSDWKVERQIIEDEAWEVKSALRPLETSFAVVIGTNLTSADSAQTFPLASLLQEGCLYIGGRATPSAIMLRILNLLKALIPFFSKANLPRFLLSPQEFHSRSNCDDDVRSPPIHRISITPRNTTRSDHLYNVSVNGGASCALANFSRLVRVEQELNGTMTGAPVVKLADEMLKSLKHHGVASRLFQVHEFKQSSIVNYFPDILQAVGTFDFKSQVLVARVNLNACPGYERADVATILMVNRPGKLLECGNGIASPACFAAKTNQPPDTTVSHPFHESSIMVMRGYNESACVLSTAL